MYHSIIVKDITKTWFGRWIHDIQNFGGKKAVYLYDMFNDACVNIQKQNSLIFTVLESINLKKAHQHFVRTMFIAIQPKKQKKLKLFTLQAVIILV